MLRFVARRLVETIITLLIIASIIFLMFRLMPGDPTVALIDSVTSPEAREQIRDEYGLNDPLYVQYFIYMKDILTLNFGESFFYKKSVVEILTDKLASTLILMFSAMILAYGIGVTVGTWMAWNRGSKVEGFITAVVLVFRSAPTFWVGIMAIYLFSVILGWLPHSGIREVGYESENFFQTYFTLDFLRHLTLPALVATTLFIATPLLVMRNSMLEVMGEDFIEMAKAKGLKERVILFRHAARNALLPVITAGALFIGTAVGGQVLLEYVFSWPGLGQEIVLAAQRQDYPLAQGSFIIMAALIMIMNLVADIIYAYIDPRISYK